MQNKNYFRLTFLLIILAELLSFIGFYFQAVNFFVFFAIVIAALILSLYQLEYGLWILLVELFIGSFGYLFYFEHGGFKISIRQALWLIILSVWSAKTLLNLIKNKKLNIKFFESGYFKYFIILFIFIVWGLINGLLNHNQASNIFQDFDRWLYFILIFPIYSVIQTSASVKKLTLIFFAAITWLSVKTLILLYIFSHNFNGFVLDAYHWVRSSGVGEITQVQGGFSRVFIQSQIFILIGLFVLLFYFFEQLNNNQLIQNKKRLYTLYFALSTLYFSTILISFSRSFWVGLAAGMIFLWCIFIFKYKIKFNKFVVFNLYILASVILSFMLSLIVVFFPLPAAYGGFNPADLFSERATEITGEAGASSRWQLLPPLWQKIKTAPLLGRGFGATVTYISNDPRVRANNPTGEDTTYAFEWGWLDVWLKLGLIGLLLYLSLFAKLIFNGLKINSSWSLSLASGLIVLAAVNMFSPYVNHLLGIGYIILTAAITDCLMNKPPSRLVIKKLKVNI